MWLHRHACMGLLTVLPGLANAYQPLSVGQQRLALLTPEGAGQLQLTDEEWQPALRTRALPSGPRIIFQRPRIRNAPDGPTIDTVSATDFIITFEANHAPVDMDSLQIEAKKWLFSTSLTDRLRPYVQGTTLQALGVSIPEGMFVIQIEIADIAGVKTVGTIG